MAVHPAVELDAQYRALREHAGLVERAERRFVAVRGPDSADYLQSQLSNDVEIPPGTGCLAVLLDRKGRIQADLRVLRLADDHYLLDGEETPAAAARKHLGLYKIGREVEVDDVSGRALISVIGPASAELVDAGPLRPEHAHRELELEGVVCRAVATDRGLDLICEATAVDAVRERLLARGAEPASEDAAEILRVEDGKPRFGRELTARTMPAEAGLEESAVSFTKGCFIGQEPVARLRYKGKPNRHLRGLRLASPAAVGDLVRAGDRELGTVATAVVSPIYGAIALALVRREAAPGAAVKVGGEIDGEVVELPFTRAATGDV